MAHNEDITETFCNVGKIEELPEIFMVSHGSSEFFICSNLDFERTDIFVKPLENAKYMNKGFL